MIDEKVIKQYDKEIEERYHLKPLKNKYQIRCDKAIEYIKNTNFWGIYEDVPMSEVKYGEELLDILEEEDYNKVERAYLDDEWIGEDKDVNITN